ncbi:MFS transporter [Actinomadura logoneensis]|uniref:MFS transporter n=1 Tax=Actinomadura logoneensis TaxID=2293572 RepID=A0A372JQA8_9ACTN|nr:MFS transporter [Actinomadura logoneensis]RFU42197.1 MFS transporter [Actinomadura logoneensis]
MNFETSSTAARPAAPLRAARPAPPAPAPQTSAPALDPPPPPDLAPASGRSAEGGARRWWVLGVASAAQFLAILDLFAVNIAFPALRDGFGGASLADVSWVLNAYTIVLAALLVPAGRIADEAGRRRVFLIGMTLFGIASVACAAAPTLGLLVAARVVQAIAGALLIPTSLGLALPAFPRREHPTVMGIWTAVAAAGAGCGPVLGGLLLLADWRWIFLINLPITAAAVLAGRRLLPRDTTAAEPAQDVRPTPGAGSAAPARRRGLDLQGAALLLASAGTLTALLTQGPEWGFPSVPTIFSGALLTVLVPLLVARLLRARDPIIDPALFRNRTFAVAVAGVGLYYLAFAAGLLATTLYFTQVMHWSEVSAALALAPVPVACMTLSPLSGRVVARIGERASAVLGGLTLAVGAAWWTVAIGQGYALGYLPGAVLFGASTALLQPPLFGASTALPGDRISLGSAVLMTTRQIASALGVAVLTFVLHGRPVLADYRLGWTLMAVAGLAAAVACVRFRRD